MYSWEFYSTRFCPLPILIYIGLVMFDNLFLGDEKIIFRGKNVIFLSPKNLSAVNKTYIYISNGQKYELLVNDTFSKKTLPETPSFNMLTQYFIKRWSEAESFTIFENHVYTSKKNLTFARNFVTTPFLGGFFFLKLHKQKFARNFVATPFLGGSVFLLCYTGKNLHKIL